MRIPNAAHEAHPWRIRELTRDFVLEDVWALPAHGGAEDFDTLLELLVSLEPTAGGSVPARMLWILRDLLGRLFGLGRVLTAGGDEEPGAHEIPGTAETSLAARLPEDLRGGAPGLAPRTLPFTPLYRTRDEFAAEMSNRTVHGVLHLAWAPEGEGRYGAQMAVYVKPRGALGRAYMALIKPFRYAIVYPALMRQVERAWDAREGRARLAA